MLLKYIIHRKTFIKGSAVLALTTVLSYALGLLRDRQFAHVFGASHTLDAYNAAFLVPDIILNVFVAGALSAAFVPIFTAILNKGDRKESDDFVSSIISGSVLIVGIVGVLAFLFAPLLSHVITKDLDAEAQHMYVVLLRMLLLSPIIFAVSNTLGGILVTKERFLWFGMSAVFYNLGIILGTRFLGPQIGIYGAGVGVIIGALLHLLPRLIASWRDFAYRPLLQLTESTRSFIKIMLPKMAGHPIEQFTFLGFTMIVSVLGEGSVSIMNFARNFQSMPIAVIGITCGLTIFPLLSKAAVRRDRRDFLRETYLSSILVFGIAALAAIVLFAIRYPLISLLLGGGKFDHSAIAATATMLAVFALSIPTESVNQILARGFYALQNSITPTLISVLGLIIAVGGAYFWRPSLGITAIAYGFLAGSLTKIILMSLLLKRESNVGRF